jgi:hypothetical protein
MTSKHSRITVWPVALSVALLALTVFALAGCGGSTSTAAGGGTNGTVSEAELGVPVYPGAKKVDVSETRGPGMRQSFPGSAPQWQGSMPRSPGSGPGWSSQGSAPATRGGAATALWTKDSSDKVTSWYRDKLKGKNGFNERTFPVLQQSGSSPPAVFSFKSGKDTRTVMVRKAQQDTGGTYITVRSAAQGTGVPFNQGQ